VYKLEDEEYDPEDKRQVRARAGEWGDRIPLGIICREQRTTFEESQDALRKGPLVKQDIDPMRVKALLEEFH
jgi:2-oxoglutarate ferredoxin oxidoreductase subunit beta